MRADRERRQTVDGNPLTSAFGPIGRRSRASAPDPRAALVVAAALFASCRAAPPSPTPPDVVVISIDTLRADHVGSYGAGGAATPVLDDLARRGVRFAHAVAPVPLTLPSHASLLTGVTPLRHGVHDNVGFALGASPPTLADRFRAAGYETQAFVSGLPLERRAGLARGFDGYDDRFTGGSDAAKAVERRADDTVAAVDRWLRERSSQPQRPLFLWVHFFDPHAPYQPPEPFEARYAGHPYDGEIAFTDAQVGALLDRLARARTGRPALVAVTADHGEGLGEHGEDTHGLLIYDSTVRVPLIITGPGVVGGRVVDNPVALVDVAPTLLDLASLPPLDQVDGVSLRPAIAGGTVLRRPTYVESLFGWLCCGWAPLRSWRDGSWTFIAAPRAELYDVAADPRQQRNVAPDHPREAAALRDALAAAVSQASPAARASASAPARARLQSLGYVGGGGTARPSLRDPKDMVQVSARIGRAIEVEAGDPAAAARELQTVLQSDPRNPLARRHLGTALLRQGRIAEATRTLQALAADGDDSTETLLLVANLALDRGDVREARSRLETVHARDPDDVTVAFKLAVVFVRGREFAAAIPLFTTVVEREPSNADALVDLAGALLQTGRPGEAVGYFQRAIDTGAGGSLAWNGLAFARRELGDRAGAAEAMRRSLAIDPNQPEIAAALANLQRR